MEIQFTIPLVASRNSPPSDPSNATAATNAATTSGNPSQGTTHRFALESRARHTRRSSARARTGCATCKKRHVKCDETRPACLNCIKWRGYCDSYIDVPADPKPVKKSRSYPTAKSGQLIHLQASPEVITEPLINTIRFTNGDQRAYFDEWASLSVSFLSGGLSQTRLWTATMPQLTLEETTLRYGAMAVGALRKACGPASNPVPLSHDNTHYLNAIIYYCEALRLQSKAKPTREGLRTALLSSLLFICFETQRGNMAAALKHITHGFSMLNELANCTDQAPGLVSIAPAPPILVQEILDCYKPLELQSRSFMGSYRKFFFTSKPGPLDRPNQTESLPSPPVNQVTTPPSQTDPPLPTYTGLPSPPSHTSSVGHEMPATSVGIAQITPQATPQTPPRGQPQSAMPPLPRPPGIQPFTKHSPYFRPRLTHITSLDNMPSSFRDFEETQGYWSLVQKHMVQHLPMLTMTTSKLRLPHARSEAEVEAKLMSVKQNPKLSGFVAESRYWIGRWYAAFEPLYIGYMRRAEQDKQSYLNAINLRIEYLILYIYSAMPRFSGLIAARGLTTQYREITEHAEVLLRARPNCGFAMDSGWTWPLFVAAFGCRDSQVRASAIRILGDYPIRNALRDSRVFRAIALKNEEAEQNIIMEGGDEATQWLRTRRREVLFEDFGTSVILRSPHKDPLTGQWELIEEVAAFAVLPNGHLDWKRQPITDAASILAGVC